MPPILNRFYFRLNIPIQISIDLHALGRRIRSRQLFRFLQNDIQISLKLRILRNLSRIANQGIFHLYRLRQPIFLFRDIAVIQHLIQNIISSGRSIIQISIGIIAIRQVDDPR